MNEKELRSELSSLRAKKKRSPFGRKNTPDFRTPDWTHVVFKNPDGVFYAVSQRVINTGYVPKDGSVVASDEERFEFYLTLING